MKCRDFVHEKLKTLKTLNPKPKNRKNPYNPKNLKTLKTLKTLKSLNATPKLMSQASHPDFWLQHFRVCSWSLQGLSTGSS